MELVSDARLFVSDEGDGCQVKKLIGAVPCGKDRQLENLRGLRNYTPCDICIHLFFKQKPTPISLWRCVSGILVFEKLTRNYPIELHSFRTNVLIDVNSGIN